MITVGQAITLFINHRWLIIDDFSPRRYLRYFRDSGLLTRKRKR